MVSPEFGDPFFDFLTGIKEKLDAHPAPSFVFDKRVCFQYRLIESRGEHKAGQGEGNPSSKLPAFFVFVYDADCKVFEWSHGESTSVIGHADKKK
jgi:hypothetical protein